MERRLRRSLIFTLALVLVAVVCTFVQNLPVVNANANGVEITGVSVKYNTDKTTVSGLRFTGKIHKSYIDEKEGVEYGMLFLPKQLYTTDADLNYYNVGYGKVAKADCTGKYLVDGDYYSIAAYLSPIGKNNYNCDYYALVYVKDGNTVSYSNSKFASIAQTAKYLLDNNLDTAHHTLLNEFILSYPVTVYDNSKTELLSDYATYGEVIDFELPTVQNYIDGEKAYIFDKWTTADGADFNKSQPILGTTKIYPKYNSYSGVILKDVNMGESDCGTVSVSYENGELITTLTSSQQWYGLTSFSNTVWNDYKTAQTDGNKIMAMDIKFGESVSLSGYVYPNTNTLNLNHLRTNTDYIRFYSANTLVAYSNLKVDTWYRVEFDINAIKNVVGEQTTHADRSDLALSRETEGTISLKNFAFENKYDTTGYKYTSVTDFDDAEYNTSEWHWVSTRNTDGVGLYADVAQNGNGYLNFDGVGQNAMFGTKQAHKNFELSFDVFDAKTTQTVAPNGELSAPTSHLRITFGNGEGSVSDHVSSDSSFLNDVTVWFYQSDNGTSTRVRAYEGGYATSKTLPEKYAFFTQNYAGEDCRVKITVNLGKVTVGIKHVTEKTYTTVYEYTMKDANRQGFVVLRGYGNQFTADRTIHESSHFKIDNIVLGDLSQTHSVGNTPNTVTPPPETEYTPKDDSYLDYPNQTAK